MYLSNAAKKNLFFLLLYLLRLLNEPSDRDGKNPLHPGVHWVWVPLAVTSLCNYFKGGIGEN